MAVTSFLGGRIGTCTIENPCFMAFISWTCPQDRIPANGTQAEARCVFQGKGCFPDTVVGPLPTEHPSLARGPHGEVEAKKPKGNHGDQRNPLKTTEHEKRNSGKCLRTLVAPQSHWLRSRPHPPRHVIRLHKQNFATVKCEQFYFSVTKYNL